MQKFRRLVTLVFGFGLLVSALNACSPIVATRGNLISPAKFEQVKPHVSHRADVMQYWGPPSATSPFDPNTWYYIGEMTSQKGIFAAKVDKRRTIRVRFDPANNDNVIEVADLDPALAQDVKPVGRTTPAAGKNFTALQQFIGNLGKYNTDTTKK